ncbi:MAG TPA: HEAT repeat domain-containing protein [Phycisphaerae bacterium]|nr:HEAT repeat domain-containing protein [Phycisphaerae bacterium]
MRYRHLAAVSILLTLVSCGAPEPTQQDKSKQIARDVLNRAITLLQLQSHSTDPPIRANCIEALQVSNDPRAEDVIDAGLQDPEWIVRFSAAMATAKRKSLPLKPVLEKMATSDPSDSVRVAAIYSLRNVGDTANMSELARTLSSSDPATRANTALVLGMMGDPSAIPLLKSHIQEPDNRVRFEITAALARLGDVHAQRSIIALAISKYPDDQCNAMAVCADLPRDVAANPLINIGLAPRGETEEKDAATRRQLIAARSLAKLHSAQGANVATDNLSNPNPLLRALAAFALGEMLVPSQAYWLTDLLSDPNEAVQRAAAAAIVNIWARSEQ